MAESTKASGTTQAAKQLGRQAKQPRPINWWFLVLIWSYWLVVLTPVTKRSTFLVMRRCVWSLAVKTLHTILDDMVKPGEPLIAKVRAF